LATKPDPLLAQAQALVAAAYNPATASLEAQRQQAAAEAAARQQGIQGFAQAAAQQVAPIAGQVQGGYQDAAARTATYSKGFSIGMQMAQQGSANDINSFLAKNGSPVGQQVKGDTGAADVLYGTTGFIPASGLEREGAAFGAAASMLPATMLGRGQQLQYESQRDAQKTDKEFLADLQAIEAKRPGAIQQALAELKNAALKDRAQRLDEQVAIEKLGISKAQLGLSAQRNQISAANAATSRDRAATSRYNADLKRLQNDRNWKAKIRALGLQEYGLDLRAAELEARLKQKKGLKGFTRGQIASYKKKAGDIASDAFADVGDTPNGYQEAIREMLTRGIPLSIAQASLNQFWTQPGQGGRPYVKFQNRRPKPKKKP
jgi:ribosomal protein L19E